MFLKERKMNIKLDKLVVEEFLVVAYFHDVIKVLSQGQIIMSSILFTLSAPN